MFLLWKPPGDTGSVAVPVQPDGCCKCDRRDRKLPESVADGSGAGLTSRLMPGRCGQELAQLAVSFQPAVSC